MYCHRRALSLCAPCGTILGHNVNVLGCGSIVELDFDLGLTFVCYCRHILHMDEVKGVWRIVVGGVL